MLRTVGADCTPAFSCATRQQKRTRRTGHQRGSRPAQLQDAKLEAGFGVTIVEDRVAGIDLISDAESLGGLDVRLLD